MRKFSIIIPVYNHPDEVDELLKSLTLQSYKAFEVIIVEDGSTNRCEAVSKKYSAELEIYYFYKENTGQGFSRNYGYSKASGDYFIVFDSDCIVPPDYLSIVNTHLNEHYLDAFGGPDRAHANFTNTQKAISYSMTSLFTTGGIRGGKKHAGRFHPRSFNMGLSREVFEKTGGYIITRMGEDIELSIRIIKNGFKVGLIDEAYVYHKRRTSLFQFWKQLHFFGRARVNIRRFFPSELKLVHMLPLFFVLAVFFWAITFFLKESFFYLGSVLLSIYYLLILIDSSFKNKSFIVGLLSVPTSFIQLTAYGVGFIQEWFSGGTEQVIRDRKFKG